MSDSVTLWTTAHQASLSFTMSWSFLKLMSTEAVMLSNHLILCHPLLLLPSIFPNIRIFSSEWALCIRWPKYWSFSFNISSSNEYARLTSFRIDWFNFLDVQGTLKNLLQHHNTGSMTGNLQNGLHQGLSLPGATADPHLYRVCSNTSREIRFSLLWGHGSFPLCPGAHDILFVPSKNGVCFS